MYFNSYKFIFIKILTAIVSSIAFSLYGSWKIYTPVSERLSNVGYHSFSNLFAFNLVPNFFIFIILGVILSPIVDSIILNKFSLKGIKGLITIILSYIFLGVMSGIIISVFFFRLDFMIHYISTAMIGSMIFLFFQTVFQVFFKLGSKQKYK